MNYKKTIIGLGIVGSTILAYNIGKSRGYKQGFVDTKEEIRTHVVNLKQETYEREQNATKIWWSWDDTTKVYTYGNAYGFEMRAFQDSYRKIDDLLNYNIDRLTKEELIKKN
jgi:hypothetical protein